MSEHSEGIAVHFLINVKPVLSWSPFHLFITFLAATCTRPGRGEQKTNFCVRIIQLKVTSHPVEIELNSRLVGDERWRLDW